MKKLCLLLTTILAFAMVHEGMHALTSFLYGEYDAFHLRFYGAEVTYKTPVPERQGLHWALIAGAPYVMTIGLGYIFFAMRHKFAAATRSFTRHLGYWFIVLFMLLDPFSMAINTFIFGGDVGGMVVGLGINKYVIQALAFAILLLNRELVVQKVFPLFGVKTAHPLLKSPFRFWRN